MKRVGTVRPMLRRAERAAKALRDHLDATRRSDIVMGRESVQRAVLSYIASFMYGNSTTSNRSFTTHILDKSHARSPLNLTPSTAERQSRRLTPTPSVEAWPWPGGKSVAARRVGTPLTDGSTVGVCVPCGHIIYGILFWRRLEEGW